MTNDAGKKMEGATSGKVYDPADWERRVADARARRQKALSDRPKTQPAETGARVRTVDASAPVPAGGSETSGGLVFRPKAPPEPVEPARSGEAQTPQPPNSVVWRKPLSNHPTEAKSEPRHDFGDISESASIERPISGPPRPSISPEADALYDVIASNQPRPVPKMLPANWWDHKPERSETKASTSRVVRAVLVGLLAGGLVGALLVKGAEEDGFLSSLSRMFSGRPDQVAATKPASPAETAAATSPKVPPFPVTTAARPESETAPVASEPEAAAMPPREILTIDPGPAAPTPFSPSGTELAAPQPDRPASISPPDPDADVAALPATTAVAAPPPPVAEKAPAPEPDPGVTTTAAVPAPDTTAEPPADATAEPPADATAEPPADATAEPPADTAQERSPDVAAAPAPIEPAAPATEAEAPGRSAPVSAARVYIHAPAGVPQDELDAVSAALRASGFTVESMIRVNLNVSSSNVRYFYGSDEQNAGAIGSVLAAPLSNAPSVRDFTDLQTQATRGHIEIWLSGSSRAGSGPRATPSQPASNTFAPASGQRARQSAPQSLPAPVTSPVTSRVRSPVTQSFPDTPRQSTPAATSAPNVPAAPEPGAIDPRRLRNLVETARDR
jgi:hypothetical protein